MPYNGTTGAYTLPAADLPVTGQIISATKMNSILNDIATALSTALAKDGQSTMTGELKLGNNKATGLAAGTVSAPGLAFSASTTTGVYSPATDQIGITVAGTAALTSTSTTTTVRALAATATDATINSIQIGFRPIPRLSTSGGTASTEVTGKVYATTGNIEIPASVFAAGDSFSIYNDSASSVTLTQGSGATLRLAGTTATGNRTLVARGMCTVWYNSATEAVVVGAS